MTSLTQENNETIGKLTKANSSLQDEIQSHKKKLATYAEKMRRLQRNWQNIEITIIY